MSKSPPTPAAIRAARHAFLTGLANDVLAGEHPAQLTVRALIRAWHAKDFSTWNDATYAEGVITRWLRDEVARGALTRHYVTGGLNSSRHSIYKKAKA